MVKLKLKLTGKKQIMQYAGDYSSDYDDGIGTGSPQAGLLDQAAT